jgi:hypothetical protein
MIMTKIKNKYDYYDLCNFNKQRELVKYGWLDLEIGLIINNITKHIYRYNGDNNTRTYFKLHLTPMKLSIYAINI